MYHDHRQIASNRHIFAQQSLQMEISKKNVGSDDLMLTAKLGKPAKIPGDTFQ